MNVFLAWPVEINEQFFDVEAHVTFKYFGNSEFKLDDLNRLSFDTMANFCYPPALSWSPEVFGDSHVMVLDGWDEDLFLPERMKLEHIRKDDYPTWRPHITFEEGIIDFIVRNEIKIADVVDSFKPLRLYVGK